MRDAIGLTRDLENVSPGLWRGRILGRPLWLVSNRDVAIDNESAPVRVVSEQSVEQVRKLAEVVIAENEMRDLYCGLLGTLHPNLRKEIQTMAAKRNKGDIDWEAFFNTFDDGEMAQLNK